MAWLSKCGAVIAMLLLAGCSGADVAKPPPLRVLLIPADGGTQDGTLADYQPLFDALARQTGLRFDLKVGQSYAMVVEAMCAGSADIAFVGPVAWLQAQRRGCAELLGVSVTNGASAYHAGFFVRQQSPLRSLADLKGRRVAFGDLNSASSFIYPVAMLIGAGVDPARDLAAVRLAGNHAASLSALMEGHVDAAALSFESWHRAVRAQVPGAGTLRLLALSDAIPNPPLVMNTGLAPALKRRLRRALDTLAQQPGVPAGAIRGYGGARVDDYAITVSADAFAGTAAHMALVDDRVKAAMLRRSVMR
jgi:phosphonate transport system substrate-binding protein